MKVAFVIQRYGMEVNGGAELLCRMIAERMSRHWDIEVLTTCALDYMSWNDHYPSGLSGLNGVKVRRFKTDFPRTVLLFNRMSEAIFSKKYLLNEELQLQWIREQGPYSSDFLRFLNEEKQNYDVIFFFTYLYGLTAFGLPRVAHKAILVPTAHDELPFHLPYYQKIFTQPQVLLFQTPEEQELVLKRFGQIPPHEVVSVGVEVKEPSSAQADELNKKIGKDTPYILYLGRVDESKGCADLFRDFIRFREENPGLEVKLVLAGKSVMEIPNRPDICHLGFIGEDVKYLALARSRALIMPSPYESLSLVTLEAWSVKTPVLVTHRSLVLKGQCERSGGGIVYEGYEGNEGFKAGLMRFLTEPEFRRQLGESGYKFVQNHYVWEKVEKLYLSWARHVQERGSMNHENGIS